MKKKDIYAKKNKEKKHSYTIMNIFLHEVNVNISNFIPPSPQSPSIDIMETKESKYVWL